MKRAIFVIFVLISFGVKSQSTRVTLDSIGYPDYRRLFTNKRAFKIYKKADRNVFYVLPTDYFNFGECSDTLEFIVVSEGTSKHIDIVSKTSCFEIRIEGNIMSLKNANQELSYNFSFLQEPKNIIVNPFKDDVLESNKELGYVLVENRLTLFTPINFLDKAFNLSVLDKNKNGEIDQEDLISVSKDNYFMSKNCGSTCGFKRSVVLKIEEEYFRLIWLGNHEFKIKNIRTTPFDLELSSKFRDVELIEINSNLSSQIKNDLTLINVWSPYCAPCIKAINELNEKSNTNIVGLYSDNIERINNLNINFPNFLIAQNEMKNLNVNGYPNYIIVDKHLNVLAKFRDLSKAFNYINNYD